MNKPFIICLIDDDDIYQFTFTKGLKGNKIAKRILVFSDGEEAIDFMLDNVSNPEALPDVIFLDINMPVMDGWEFLEEFVELKPKVGKEITIYMVSSSVDPADVDRAKAISDVSDYLIKPVGEDQLQKIIAGIES
ncbi:Response regulator receiver domain protein [Owenweeksia hongkongensis DSM 17368]|uniref:Response regulator receiver domain protein n=1 Tax=Owenweeksia hongkongensis (strain DSM 17368 / CIP 108786 / JCM 12287 / NRRL B-23963 / UST20020801) TaxID=926562 RepID=G8R3B6_OWEHD|nr:response regulator [Owenweeksia hongkongensis]AEV31937.1 Response regulator receiver domain protein [Owenweeksia hongkongensis DSM 17368]